MSGPIKVNGYAATSKESPLTPWAFERRAVGPADVRIEIQFSGICHSDIHQARNEWGGSIYPMVPGHEIVGKVVEVGKDVKKFQVGDLAGVGCMVDSCRECDSCKVSEEQYCDKREVVLTYNSRFKDGTPTYGGYSEQIVVDEAFSVKISPKLDLAATAPLLCAGITTWSPLRHWGVKKGSRVGVVGLGGLGHMALKFAHALGAYVVQFSTTPSKVEDAKKLGADEVIITTDPKNFDKIVRSLDVIIDTVAGQHELEPYLNTLKRDGTLVQVGAPPKPLSLPVFSLIPLRRAVAGSTIGGIKETQEMLDFCAEHNIVSDIEVIPIQKVNEAYERVLKSDVKYRFVIDISSLKA